jgi:hypothetical protein
VLELDSPDCVEPLVSDPLEAFPAGAPLPALESDPLDVDGVSDPSAAPAPDDVLDLLAALGVSLAGLRVPDDVLLELLVLLFAFEPAALAL